MAKRYVYHYYGVVYAAINGTNMVDGIITIDGPILSYEDSVRIKESIIDFHKLGCAHNKLILKSLSFLHSIDGDSSVIPGS